MSVLRKWGRRMAKMAAKKFIVKEELADKELEEARLRVCRSCPDLIVEDDMCGVCKCFVDIKAGTLKEWHPASNSERFTHCPMGRWGDRELANMYREMDGKDLIKEKE